MTILLLVVGAGQMGAGIAQVCAMADCQVTLSDISGMQLAKARAVIDASLAKLVARSQITREQASNASQIASTESLQAAAHAP